MNDPRLLTLCGFLWRVEYDDNALGQGTTRLVRAWTFSRAYRQAEATAPKRDPQYRQIKVVRMERVTPLTVRYWDMHQPP